MKILYFGGQKSGKSFLASKKTLELSTNKPYYVATYDNSYNDSSMENRVNKHIKDREDSFITVEEALDLRKVIKKGETYLIDCISMWIFNNIKKDETYLLKQLEELFLIEANIIFVINDVSSGVIPFEKSSRVFVDYTGIVGQLLTKNCDEVYEAKFGLQVRLK